MIIRTIHANSVRTFEQAWTDKTADGFTPGTALLFASTDLELSGIVSFLNTQNVQVMGCSSCGEFIFDQDKQVISDGGLVCMLLSLPAGHHAIRLFPGHGDTSFSLGEQIGTWALEQFNQPAVIILAGGLETDGEQLVRGVQLAAGETITMFGGLAGDDARFSATFVFSESEIVSYGAIVMALDTGFYNARGIATSGWVGIGADKVITHAEGNVVYTIDNEPALDVYKRYLDVRDEDLPEVGIEFPLLVKKTGAPDVLRAVINVDKEKRSLIFAGTVPQKAIVTFSTSPGFEIIEDTRNKINEFHRQNNETDFLILFSCMARHNALGPSISEEIDDAWQKWRKPLIGFFTYGEIGSNYQSVCDFHNETFTMVSIKQK